MIFLTLPPTVNVNYYLSIVQIWNRNVFTILLKCSTADQSSVALKHILQLLHFIENVCSRHFYLMYVLAHYICNYIANISRLELCSYSRYTTHGISGFQIAPEDKLTVLLEYHIVLKSKSLGRTSASIAMPIMKPREAIICSVSYSSMVKSVDRLMIS